jgi:hypothetical protein
MVLFTAFTIHTAARVAASRHQDEVNAMEVMREYREWNAYDGTTVNYSDILTMIFRQNGTHLVVRLENQGGALQAEWRPEHWRPFRPDGTVNPLRDNNRYTLAFLEARINNPAVFPRGFTTRFNSTIQRDESGTVIGVTFRDRGP